MGLSGPSPMQNRMALRTHKSLSQKWRDRGAV